MTEEVMEPVEEVEAVTEEVSAPESDYIEAFKQLNNLAMTALQEARNLENNKVKASATRCRNALNEAKKLCLELRKETVEVRNAI